MRIEICIENKNGEFEHEGYYEYMSSEEVVQKECLRYCKHGSDYDDEDK